jgi:hypothetical protein
VLFAISVYATLNTIWQWCIDPARSDPCFSHKQWIAPILITATFFVFAHFGLNWIIKAIEDYMLIVGIVVIAFVLLGITERPVVRELFILLGLVGLIPLTILYCALHFFNLLQFNIISTLTSTLLSIVVFILIIGICWAVSELKSWIRERKFIVD